jgi:hypothetical protein
MCLRFGIGPRKTAEFREVARDPFLVIRVHHPFCIVAFGGISSGGVALLLG